jgi:hypothetical protein
LFPSPARVVRERPAERKREGERERELNRETERARDRGIYLAFRRFPGGGGFTERARHRALERERDHRGRETTRR